MELHQSAKVAATASLLPSKVEEPEAYHHISWCSPPHNPHGAGTGKKWADQSRDTSSHLPGEISRRAAVEGPGPFLSRARDLRTAVGGPQPQSCSFVRGALSCYVQMRGSFPPPDTRAFPCSTRAGVRGRPASLDRCNCNRRSHAFQFQMVLFPG